MRAKNFPLTPLITHHPWSPYVDHPVLHAGNMNFSPGLEEALSPSGGESEATCSDRLNNRVTVERKVLCRVQVGLLEEMGSDRERQA